jgi:ribokinase
MAPLHLQTSKLLYQAMIGTGGVGSGSFFALEGDHTLGREESRAGRFLDRQDYCKLHIVSHYVQALLGPGFAVIPASKVGADRHGQRLLAEMQEAGLDLRYMHVDKNRPTLFSFCFSYPNGSGGNLTTSDAATAAVDPDFINTLEDEFARWPGQAIALAVPEVPLPARQRLLELGTVHQALRVAGLTSAEACSPQIDALLQNVDLLSINLDEARALARVPETECQPAEALARVVDRLQVVRPDIGVSLTAGKEGSWCWDGAGITHTPAFQAEVVSTAGAGDAHLGGLIAGLAAGLSLGEAHQLAGLVAGLSVQSPHTIHKQIDRASLSAFARHQTPALSAPVLELLEDQPDALEIT